MLLVKRTEMPAESNEQKSTYRGGSGPGVELCERTFSEISGEAHCVPTKKDRCRMMLWMSMKIKSGTESQEHLQLRCVIGVSEQPPTRLTIITL